MGEAAFSDSGTRSMVNDVSLPLPGAVHKDSFLSFCRARNTLQCPLKSTGSKWMALACFDGFQHVLTDCRGFYIKNVIELVDVGWLVSSSIKFLMCFIDEESREEPPAAALEINIEPGRSAGIESLVQAQEKCNYCIWLQPLFITHAFPILTICWGGRCAWFAESRGDPYFCRDLILKHLDFEHLYKCHDSYMVYLLCL